MFSALFWKHVRQVRSLFWQGTAFVVVTLVLGFVLKISGSPFGLGFVPTSITESWDDMAPSMLMFFVLPMATLAFVVQVLSGDAAEGCEEFLGSRPVRRETLWSARIGAALALSVVLAAASAFVAALLATGHTSLAAAFWIFGSLVLLAATAGFFVVSIGAQRMSGIIVGFMVMLGLTTMSVSLGETFEPVRRWSALWCMFAPFAISLALLWTTRAVGEPAGRGRLARGTATLVAGFALCIPTFLYGADVLARRPPHSPDELSRDVRPSPRGEAFVVGATNRNALRAWLLPARGDGPRAFLQAPVQTLAWTPDGATLALVTRAGAHGTARSRPLVRFLDDHGAETRPAVTLWDTGTHPIEAMWAGDRVLLRAFATTEKPDIWVVRSGVPAWRFHLADFGAVRLLGASADGTAYIAQYDGGQRPSDFAPRSERDRIESDPKSAAVHVWLKVFRLRPGADAPDEQPVLAVPDVSTIPGAAHLSRDGRLFYYLEQGTPKVVDLATGATVPFAMRGAVAKVAWLDLNRLLWSEAPGTPGEAAGASAESRAFVAGAGEEPREIAHGLRWILPEPSPDGRRVLVTEVEGVQGGRRPLAYWLYDDTTQRWSSLDAIGGRGTSLATRLWWAGNHTLLRTTADAIELVPLAEPGKARRIWD